MAWENTLWTATLLGAIAGCPKPQIPTGPPLCLRENADTCTGAACGGGNSPFTNIFPVNGVSAIGDGACNADGIRLTSGSLEGGKCVAGGSDLVLDETGTKLIGKKHGQTTCSGADLTGASFLVHRAKHDLRLTISEVRQFDDDGPDHAHHEGYRITYNDNQLCDFDASRMVLHDLGFQLKQESQYVPLVPFNYHPGPNDDLVIAVAGPVFDVTTAEPITEPGLANFFNLACVGDALAKTSFYKLAGAARDTKAALRMITANYCGRRMTVRGMHIEWQSFPPRSLESAMLEAEWDRDGNALCIETPRLMELRTETPEAVLPPQQLTPELQPKGCESNAAPPGKCDKDCWILHLKEECDVHARCSKVNSKRVRFKSFVDTAGHSIILDDASRYAH